MANTTNLDLVKPLGTDHALVAQINSNSDKIDAEAGKARANFAAEYSASSAYAVGAFCTHNGILYQCNTAIGSGGEAWTSGHWTQISAGDAIVANNQAIATLDYQIVTSGDFDNLTGNNVATVWYRGENLSNFTNTPPDVSSNAWPFALEVIKIGAGYAKQILHLYAVFSGGKTQDRTFIRQQTYRNSAIEWGAWEELASVLSGTWTPAIPRATFTVVANSNKYVCTGNIVVATAQINVTASETSNAYINNASLPTFGKSIVGVSGSWMDNSSDKGGSIKSYGYNSSVWFDYQGSNHPLTDQVGHNVGITIVYSLA